MSGKTFDHENWMDLERAVRARMGPEPTAAMENRVLAGVRRALSEAGRAPARRWTGGAHLAAVAAMLIVGLALAQMAASVTPFFDRPVSPAPVASIHAAADLMRQASPGLTADEADRLALASAFRGELLPVPIANADGKLPGQAGGLNFQGDLR